MVGNRLEIVYWVELKYLHVNIFERIFVILLYPHYTYVGFTDVKEKLQMLGVPTETTLFYRLGGLHTNGTYTLLV